MLLTQDRIIVRVPHALIHGRRVVLCSIESLSNTYQHLLPPIFRNRANVFFSEIFIGPQENKISVTLPAGIEAGSSCLTCTSFTTDVTAAVHLHDIGWEILLTDHAIELVGPPEGKRATQLSTTTPTITGTEESNFVAGFGILGFVDDISWPARVVGALSIFIDP